MKDKRKKKKDKRTPRLPDILIEGMPHYLEDGTYDVVWDRMQGDTFVFKFKGKAKG